MKRFRSVAAVLVWGNVLVCSAVRADPSGLTPAAAEALGAPLGVAPETGAPLGPFLVYPELMLGGVYNDNLFPGSTTRQASFGYRIAPTISAIDDDGLRKTSLYFNADAELYPGAGAEIPWADKAAVSLAAQARQTWTPREDVSVQAGIAFSRQNALLEAPVVTASRFIAAPDVINLTNGAQYTDLVRADASFEKTLGAGFFVRAGAAVEKIAYEADGASAPAGAQDYNGSLRLGYALTPALSGFTEGDFDRLRGSAASQDIDIYRAVAGLSSDLISLFRGDLYIGYQRQTSADNAFAPVTAPTFGGRLYYYPTPYLTLSAGLDQTFGLSTGVAPATPAPSPDVLQARIEATYAFATYWRATATLGWAKTTVATTPPTRAVARIANARFDYNFWRNLDITLAYQFSELKTQGGALRGYDQNLTTLGLTYKY